ncbi:hypothetical protein BD408DRAFT_96645 [Parasitella parasitica]|nr:hypothetical protein BD408DRAFT_96645 [Parasitella parasitica]
MENELSARNKDIFNPARTDTFDNFKYAWKIADAEAISYIVDDLNMESKSAKLAAQYNQERTIGLLDDTETLKDDKDVIGEYLDANEFDKPLEGVALTNELETKESYLQAKRPDIDALFEKIDSKLAQLKEQSTEQLPTKYSKMKRFELEKIVRDIRRDINTYDDKVYRLSTKELDLRRKIKD